MVTKVNPVTAFIDFAFMAKFMARIGSVTRLISVQFPKRFQNFALRPVDTPAGVQQH